MKKLLTCLFILGMLVGCSNKPTYYEEDTIYKINDYLEMSFKRAYECYYLGSDITSEIAMPSYKMIEIMLLVDNKTNQRMPNITELLDFSATMNGESIPVWISKESNRYGKNWLKDMTLGYASYYTLSMYFSPMEEWDEIILTENTSSQEWIIEHVDVKDRYYYGSTRDVNFFERLTTLNSNKTELRKFYGVEIELQPGQEIIGITEDEQFIGLTQIMETDDTIITSEHVVNSNSNWYGSSLYPIKGYIVTDREGLDIYYNRTLSSQKLSETHEQYISTSEIGVKTVELDGNEYPVRMALSMSVYYKDGKIDNIDKYTLHFTETPPLPMVGTKVMQGSYTLSDDGKKAHVTYKIKFFSETDESDWVILKGTIK